MEIIHRIFDWKGIPILVGVFIVLFFIEEKFQLRRRVQTRYKRMMISNVVSIPSFILLRFLFIPIVIWLAIQNEDLQYGIRYFVSLPWWLTACISFLLFDYGNYLWHVINHKVPLLWRFHLVHHTDLDLDIHTAARFHFGEMVGSVFFRGAFIFISGAVPLTVIVYEIVFEAATLFHHSNIKIPLRVERVLNKVFVTPRMHGIHHSMVRNETDSNYSVIFSFWDRLHKTLKLNVHQSDLVIGVPTYSNPDELTAVNLLKMPFTSIRQWKKEHETNRNATGNKTEMVE